MKFTLKLKNITISDEDLKADVLRVMKLVEPLPLSSTKYNELGKFNSDTVSRRLGQRRWNNVLKLFGAPPVQVFHTEQDLLDNIAKVWISKGEQPTRRDMDNNLVSTISSGAYLRKYGKWNIALTRFVEYVNSEDSVDFSEVDLPKNIIHHTRREPSNRLKVKVLMRDGNRCGICGIKCDDGIHKLHFDHIIPWSRGGETTFDNLRVLCKSCNEILGNSNEIK